MLIMSVAVLDSFSYLDICHAYITKHHAHVSQHCDRGNAMLAWCRIVSVHISHLWFMQTYSSMQAHRGQENPHSLQSHPIRQDPVGATSTHTQLSHVISRQKSGSSNTYSLVHHGLNVWEMSLVVKDVFRNGWLRQDTLWIQREHNGASCCEPAILPWCCHQDSVHTLCQHVKHIAACCTTHALPLCVPYANSSTADSNVASGMME